MRLAGPLRTTGRAARRLAAPVMFAVALCAVLFLGVLPTRAYLDKRADIGAAEARAAQLEQANDAAQRHVDALRTDAEIERVAREQWGLVKPGEESYHVLPPPRDPARLPDVWPFGRVR